MANGGRTQAKKWWTRADGAPTWMAPKGTPMRTATRRIVSLLAVIILVPVVWDRASEGDWVAVLAIPVAIALGYVWRDFDVR